MCCAATLVRRGCLFQSTTDSEVFVHLIAISLYSTVVDRLIDALKQVIGAYSLVALSNEALMGVRDPLGVRPLILGRIGNEGTGGWVLASRDLRARYRRRRLRARRRAWRDRRDQRPGRAQHQAVRPLARTVLRVRIHLFRAARFGDGGHAGLRRAQAHRRRTGARDRRAGRRGGAGAGFRRAGGDGLRDGKRHPVRAWYHPQPLCRPHLHRTDRPHPPSRREAEALRQPARC